MTQLEELLAVQEHDTTIDQLTHRLETLPERVAREELTTTVAEHDRRTREIGEQRDRLVRDQRKLEDEVAAIEAKAAEVDATLYSGSVTSPRELQALQDDIASLRRRQRQLEDGVLELMEQIEPVDTDLAEREAARGGLDERANELDEALAQAEASISQELAAARAERDALAGSVEAALLERYESMRPRMAGVAVARLVGSNCAGCHLSLPAAELDRIRHEPPDAMVTCSECGRLLVR